MPADAMAPAISSFLVDASPFSYTVSRLALLHITVVLQVLTLWFINSARLTDDKQVCTKLPHTKIRKDVAHIYMFAKILLQECHHQFTSSISLSLSCLEEDYWHDSCHREPRK
jgi:hypothetical protein